MTNFAEVKISQFSPVPGKPVSKIINSKKSLHVAPTSPIVSPRHGGVAQLGERLTGSQEVRGSIPLVSTIVNVRPSEFRRLFFMLKFLALLPHIHTNKKLHNLFHMSVHSLLDKRNFQCSSQFHLGFRNAPNYCQHPNNLRQLEQHSKTTPFSTLNERYVVQRSPNQFR